MEDKGHRHVEREASRSRLASTRPASTGHGWGATRLPALNQAALLALQRTAGNAAVCALLARPDLRPSLQPGVPITLQRNGEPPAAAIKKLPAGAHWFAMGDKFFATDGKIKWHWQPNRKRWHKLQTLKKSKGSGLYGRFTIGPSGRGAPRGASFRSRMGSAAEYRVGGRRVLPAGIVIGPATKGRRKQGEVMAVATGHASATAFAIANGGVAGIPYEWCHLIARSLGGKDEPANLVAASKFNNSEQLQIESVLKPYRNNGDVTLHVTSTLFNGIAHLASKLTYVISVKGKAVYTREMEGFRTDKPTYVELEAVRAGLTQAITKALK